MVEDEFIEACIRGDEPGVRQYLSAQPELVNGRGKVRSDHREFMRSQGAEDGWNPLHLAAHYGQPGVVTVLLDCGADVNAWADNSIGNTPLMAAVAGGSAAIVRQLLDRGADPRKKDRAGSYDAVSLAQGEGRAEIAAIFKESLARVR